MTRIEWAIVFMYKKELKIGANRDFSSDKYVR